MIRGFVATRPWLLAALLLLPGLEAAAQTPASPSPPPPNAPAAAAQAPTTPTAPTAPTAEATVVASPLSTQADIDAACSQVFTVGLDLEHPLSVAGLKMKRDTLDLQFVQGTMYLAKPIAGQITGAYFKGLAAVRLTLPNAFDRKRMEAAIGQPTIDMKATEIVLRFDDGAEKEILAAGRPGSAAGDPSGTWNDRLKIDAHANDTAMAMLQTRLNASKQTTTFIAELTPDGKTWYSFAHDGGHRVENGFYKEEFLGAGGKRWYRTITEFHRPEDYDKGGNYDVMPEFDAKEVALVRHVEMTVEIPNTKSVLIDAKLTVEAMRDNVRAIRFDFENNQDDSGEWDATGRPVTANLVADGDGKPLPYVHRYHELLVLLPRALAKGEKTVVRVKATEDTIIQLTDKSYWIYTDHPWFPQIGYFGGRFTMDWTVRVAKPMTAAGTGDIVKEWEEGNFNCARWKSDTPVSLASFIFGTFKVTEGVYTRQAPGTGQVKLRIYTKLGGLEHSKANPESVLFNLKEGIKTYETIFGPIPYNELDVAEMAENLGFAQEPAGVLLVSSVPVGSVTLADDDGVYEEDTEAQGGLGKVGGGGTGDQFVFHELAHAWWGDNVGEVGWEDNWIGESFAEYSMGLMIDAIDPKRFRVVRKKWKQHAMEGDPFGTLDTAYRSDSPEHPNIRWDMVYNKGPYVLHMLRTWMGWEKFSQFLNTIQTKYKDTLINTDTLAREAGKVMGYSMFPFFDQWVRDKGVPRVHYSWTSAADADGKQVVTIKLRQEDKDNPKILMLPIALDFGKGAPTIVPKPLLKAEGEIQLRVPEKPKGVSLDPAETQLAVFINDDKK